MTIMEEPVLIIKKPIIELIGDNAVLKSEIVENGVGRTMFFSVEKRFARGLVDNLSDAFLVAVFSHCMIEKLNIVCEAPVSRHLLYSLKNRLIPELSARTERYHQISITADADDTVFQSEKAVGVGWSGGVDCMYTFMKNRNSELPHYKITHLVNINAGAFEGSLENCMREFAFASEKAKKAAEEFGLEHIDIDTNIHLLYDEIYLSVAPQRLCAAVLALQKLFSNYYISSAYEVTSLSFDENNSAYYEFTICSSLCTQNTSFYDIGSNATRIEKLKQIAEDDFSRKNLHVCVKESDRNCGHCLKCIRTISALYALEKLENFSEAFDLGFVYENIDMILGKTYHYRKSQHFGESVSLMNAKGMELSFKAKKYAAFLDAAEKAIEKHRDTLLKNEVKNYQ